jgi:enoyl-CoA hydratase/carnithine racemase
MTRALQAALEAARDDPALNAVVVMGAGPAFSAGADLRELVAERPPLAQALERRELGALFRLMDEFPKPLVAAVNGDALGAGFGLVAACHLALAAESARFGLPGVRLGIMPMTIMPAIFRTLPRKLGLELMLTGRLMSSTEAVEQGFVNRLVGTSDLEPAATALAERASNTPLTIPDRLTTL